MCFSAITQNGCIFERVYVRPSDVITELRKNGHIYEVDLTTDKLKARAATKTKIDDY